MLSDHIFRAYDIRGKAFTDFDEDGFFLIAQALAIFLTQQKNIKNPKIFVSGDGRNSMTELYPAVLEGLILQGAKVTWGGTITTPINYFALRQGGFDGAIQISASHNPPEDNGLKISTRKGVFFGADIQWIKNYIPSELKHLTYQKSGSCAHDCQPIDFFSDYQKKLKSLVSLRQKKKLVVDAGNGVAGIFYPQILRQSEQEVFELYTDLNPFFPNHQPDPERAENLADLQKTVIEKEADFGFAYDGDGDRLGIVLADGKILNADKIFAILCADFLSRNPGGNIVLDVMSGQILAEKIQALGGKIFWSKTGHSYIEKAMHEKGIKLGGEQSGHFMFGENFYGHDDACLATLRFLSAVEKNPQWLDMVTKNWPKTQEFSEKIAVAESEKFSIVDRAIGQLKQKFPDHFTIDGIRINFGNGEWGIVRASNTSACIAVRIETHSIESLEEKKKIILENIRR